MNNIRMYLRGKVFTGFKQLRIRPSDGFLYEHSNEPIS